jgi:predicted nucleotidyltransferase component of viral defense system
MTKNIGKSIKTRLLNLARNEKQEYMKVLVRYLHERLLYRISVSTYKSHFLLKGSSLLFALDGFKARPTVDIDLLGEKISNDQENLYKAFCNICSIACEEDGVVFDVGSLILEPIALEKKYPGTCVKVTAHLDTIVQQISVDIGFGDVVTPYPLALDYPLLLDGVPPIELYAYSLETLIAEKFHTMVDRDESNSRMKDFFDVYQLFTCHDINPDLLQEAVVSTFKNRNTTYHDGLKLFTEEFATNPTRNIWWKAFLKKLRWKEQIEFPAVMECVKANLLRYWDPNVL